VFLITTAQGLFSCKRARRYFAQPLRISLPGSPARLKPIKMMKHCVPMVLASSAGMWMLQLLFALSFAFKVIPYGVSHFILDDGFSYGHASNQSFTGFTKKNNLCEKRRNRL
jgi:hypothetical protein